MSDKQARVLKVIAEQFGIPEAEITPEKKIVADLGADSLDAIEIAMAIEDEFNIEINDEEIEKCVTVQDVYDLVSRYAS